ncbi:MAG: acyltransferase family protein [Gordonia sp. (in: high G+C Gram-positive bacteria)]|uniref:acyltransferase family protein n=1 Tax=Gordonia sp. (in: high G+C Gram-positive bacteria) TaxID=84139 RepID=UPI0039E62DEB
MPAPTRQDESQQPLPTPNEDAATGNTSGYRLDLDGLRGIAIFLVAVFHVWFGRVSGGVDVFLTLSGYFFVASLLKHVIRSVPPEVSWRQAINPWPRLSRLLRRLIPALFLVLAFVTAMIWLIMPTTRWQNLGQELIASALYYQNYHLGLGFQEYGAADSGISPMQHLWSMSMQGQFFVVTLLAALTLGALIKLGARRRPQLADPAVITRIVGVSLLAVTLASIAWANYRHGVNQPLNYYDTIARVWEPLLGGLAAVWMPRLALPDRVRTVLTALGVVLIATSGIWIDGVASYPAFPAFVPVGATILIMWVGSAATAPRNAVGAGLSAGGRVLAHPAIVWLGSIAYSLYLWHWPLLIFYLAWRFKDGANVVEGAVILALSVLLAWASTRWIEAPLRAGRGDGFSRRYHRILTAILVMLTVFTTASAIGWQVRAGRMNVDTTNLDPKLYPGARAFLEDAPVPNIDPVPSPEQARKDWPINHRGFFSNFGDPAIRVGVFGDVNAARTIAVAGGSHSEHWMTALDMIGKQRGFKVTTYMKAGCAMSSEAQVKYQGRLVTECQDWVQRVMDRIAADRPDYVFTTATRPKDTDGDGDVVPKGYLDVFDRWRSEGQKVIAVRDTPWATDAPLDPPDCVASGRKPTVCGVERDHALSPVDPTDALVPEYPNMTFLDYSDGMCTADYCPAVVGNILVWHDRHHLTTAFVRSLAPFMDRDLAHTTSWW